ncbi:MAG: hypothetical protein IKC11_02605, partial [Clostridia bacterium]|nr:hypothetical protein [Clostridia bacterium]
KQEQVGMDFGDINFQTRFFVVSRCYTKGSCLRVLAQKTTKMRVIVRRFVREAELTTQILP